MKQYALISILLLILSMFSCTSEVDTETITKEEGSNVNTSDLDLSNQALITDFKITATNSKGVKIEASSISIDQDTKTIQVVFPFNTILKDLLPIITVSKNATIIGNDKPLDFSNEVTYIISAENKDKIRYSVITILTRPTNKEVLIEMFNNTPEADKPNWDLSATDINTWSGVTAVDEIVTRLSTPKLSISGEIKYLDQINDLSINDFHSELPSDIKELKNLEALSITLNPEKESNIPNFIGDLKNLKKLVINPIIGVPSNKTNTIGFPESLKQLEKLEILNIYSAKLQAFPKEITELKSLKKLEIIYSQISQTLIPKEFNQLTDLESILIVGTGVEFTSSLENLVNLKSISLPSHTSKNTGINEFILTAKNLEILSYSGSITLSTIPKGINQLKKLKSLDLTATQVTSTPAELLQILTLETLSFQGSKLETLPEGLGLLKNLKTVNITGTPITRISQSLCDLEKEGKKVVIKDFECPPIKLPPIDPIVTPIK